MIVSLIRLPTQRRVLFQKVIFELPSSGPRTPDGQSLTYLTMARELWLKRWAHDSSEGEGRVVRVMHDAVQRAYVLERQLLDLLERAK
jgi:hypothetical protein